MHFSKFRSWVRGTPGCPPGCPPTAQSESLTPQLSLPLRPPADLTLGVLGRSVRGSVPLREPRGRGPLPPSPHRPSPSSGGIPSPTAASRAWGRPAAGAGSGGLCVAVATHTYLGFFFTLGKRGELQFHVLHGPGPPPGGCGGTASPRRARPSGWHGRPEEGGPK